MKALLLSEYKKLNVVDMPTPDIGDEDVLACIVAGAPPPWDASPVPTTCYDAVIGDEDVLACIAEAAAAPADGTGIVQDCADAFFSDEDILQCIADAT